MPLAHFVSQVPPQPSGPPQLPAQVGVQGPPSLSAKGMPEAGTDGPDSAVTEEHAARAATAKMTAPKDCFIDR